MLELILKIREHTEAGSILEHMDLFDELQSIKFVGMYCGVNAWALDVNDEILVDEVESKTCENCKYFTRLNRHGHKCSNKDSCVGGCVNKDFGCNKWQPK